MRTVTLTMTDTLNNKEVIRTIDGLNAYSSGSVCYELRGENEQRRNLENWISKRGNEQHNTKLTLVSWNLNNF